MIVCEPATMPTAKTPTAIESTTRIVRPLWPHRSRSTLRQRGLSMTRPPAASRVLGEPVAHQLGNLLPGRPRFGQQAHKGVAVERGQLDPALQPSANGGYVLAP